MNLDVNMEVFLLCVRLSCCSQLCECFSIREVFTFFGCMVVIYGVDRRCGDAAV